MTINTHKDDRPVDKKSLHSRIPLLALSMIFLCTCLTLCITIFSQKKNIENYIMAKKTLYATKLSEMIAWNFCRVGRTANCTDAFYKEKIEERPLLTCDMHTGSKFLAATNCFPLTLQTVQPAEVFETRWLTTPLYYGQDITLSDILDLPFDVDRERVFIIDDALILAYSSYPWLAGIFITENYNMYIHFTPGVSSAPFRAEVNRREFLVSHARIGNSRYHVVIAGTPDSVLDILMYASRSILISSIMLLFIFSSLMVIVIRHQLFPLKQLAEATRKITLIDFYRVNTGYREVYYIWNAIYGYHLQVTGRMNSLFEEACTDPLTRLYNRRGLSEALGRKEGNSHWLMLADIDNFKSINDRFGHAAGDEVLIEVAGILTQYSRLNDVCCRFGGEEFILFMPDTTKKEALHIAQSICDVVAAHPFRHAGRVTLSAGLASMCEADGQLDTCLNLADKALYCAKNQGKNQVSA